MTDDMIQASIDYQKAIKEAERLAKIEVLELLLNDVRHSIESDPQNDYCEGYADGKWQTISDIEAIINSLKAGN